MDFLNAAGLNTNTFVSIHDVRLKQLAVHELFLFHRDWLPAELKKRGDRMIEVPENARALMSFLRCAARKEQYLVWTNKKQVVHPEGKKRTSLYSYKLISAKN
ncbi:MAG: hypothetical protein CL967_05560 [Euryarchaeota archaeon]|nr:hypothetical protein [Euryarchaeota archaeon]|tara:strand:+ start:1437 stop:1745 length:309 start_codon:yes stop_codon:yes gene_type:complete